MNKKIILVTGANKGIGLEIVRQLARKEHEVILTARDKKLGQEAVKKLAAENLAVRFIQLDITDRQSIRIAAEQVKQTVGRIDVLLNNAAILLKEDQSLLTNSFETILQTLDTNALSQLKVSRHFLPLLVEGSRIIMTSSEGGSMVDTIGGWSPAYCVSKSMLNAITRHLSHELAEKSISVNAFCPGWVNTDMGGIAAPRTVEQGADTAVWLATASTILTGKFFRDRKEIPW